MLYKFDSDDNDNCRVYYTRRDASGRKRWFCIQNDGGWGRTDLKFYSCTSDGEPSYSVAMPAEADFDKYVLPR